MATYGSGIYSTGRYQPIYASWRMAAVAIPSTDSTGQALAQYIFRPAAISESKLAAQIKWGVMRGVRAHEAANSNGRAVLRAIWGSVETDSDIWVRQRVPTDPVTE